MSGSPASKTFSTTPIIALTPNETALGPDFAIWALSGLTALPDGKTLLGVFPALNERTSTDLYSTMAAITVLPPSQIPAGSVPPTKRLGTGRLFYPGEVQYGTFAMAVSGNYLYLFGSDKTGIKVARTPLSSNMATLADRKTYTYYQPKTSTWTSTPAVKNDASTTLIAHSVDFFGQTIGPDTGDVFWSAYHKTWVMVWMDALVDGVFWASYSLSGTLMGAWSTPLKVWTSPVPKECAGSNQAWNYQGHSHAGWDVSGKTLLISYASCVDYVSMATITWG